MGPYAVIDVVRVKLNGEEIDWFDLNGDGTLDSFSVECDGVDLVVQRCDSNPQAIFRQNFTTTCKARVVQKDRVENARHDEFDQYKKGCRGK